MPRRGCASWHIFCSLYPRKELASGEASIQTGTVVEWPALRPIMRDDRRQAMGVATSRSIQEKGNDDTYDPTDAPGYVAPARRLGRGDRLHV